MSVPVRHWIVAGLMLVAVAAIAAPALASPRPRESAFSAPVAPRKSVAAAFPTIPLPTNVNVSRASANQNEPAIAVNPANPQQIAVESNDENATPGIFFAVSNDGGKTWSTRHLATGGSDPLGSACCDPSLAWDSFGNLFVGFLDSTSTNGDYARMLFSADGGQTFSPIVYSKASRLGGPTAATRPHRLNALSTGNADQPTVQVGPGLAWITYADTNNFIAASGVKVTGLGQVSAPFAAEEAPNSGGGNFGDIAIGPNGQVMVTYQYDLNAAGPDVIAVNVEPNGAAPVGFSQPITVTNTMVGGERIVPATSNNFGIDAEAGLAWDRSGGPNNGRVYLMYTDAPDTITNTTHIMLRSSNDTGTTWSTAKQLDDDGTSTSHILPRIALDQTDGDVAVTWYDARNDPSDKTIQLFGTYSADGGATFSPNFLISAGTTNSADSEPPGPCCRPLGPGDYIGAAFQSGHFYPVWADNSNSTGDNPDGTLHKMDIYTASVPIPPVSLPFKIYLPYVAR